MNLQKRLNIAAVDCFRMAHFYKSRIHEEEMIYSPWNDELPYDYDISNNYVASQYGLICEYYMKGILLPTLEITNPDNNPVLQQIITSLSDEEKYRIIIGDNDIERELSKKYNISLKEIKKLSGESLKNIGHNLKSLSQKILEKAQENRFDSAEKNSILERFFKDNILQFAFLDKFVADSFIKGRYGHLDETEIDVTALNKATACLDEIIDYFYKGISITLFKEEDYGDTSVVDHKTFYLEDVKKVIVIKKGQNKQVSRVYVCKDGLLIPEYGVEDEVDTDINLYRNSTTYYSEEEILEKETSEQTQLVEFVKTEAGVSRVYIENPFEIIKQKKAQKGYNARSGILVETGDLIYIMRNKEESFFVETVFGKIAVSSDWGKEDYQTLITEYEDALSQKNDGKKKISGIRYSLGTRLTGKLVDIQPGSIGEKYLRNIRSREKYDEQKDAIKWRSERPTALEFRKVYGEFVQSTLAYRISKGKESFLQIMEEIKKTIQNVTNKER